jgi:serine/threonine-protein kinase RsbW
MGPRTSQAEPGTPSTPVTGRARPLRLAVEGNLAALEQARLAIDAFLGQLEPPTPARTVFAVELVLEEWLTNVWHHGAGPGAMVEIVLSVEADTLELRFEDRGPPFDPTTRPVPPRPRSIDEARPGGLGLLFIRTQALDWHHVRDQGSNVLTVRIARHGPAIQDKTNAR